MDTLSLEGFVADREHFVGDQHIGFQRRGDRETEPHGHSRGIMLHRLVDMRADVRKGNDLVETAFHLRARKPHKRRG